MAGEGTIDLPTLVQRVRVDTRSMARAEKRAASFGRAFGDAARGADDAAGGLSESAALAADSADDLGDRLDDTGRSADRAGKATDRLAEKVADTARATERARESLSATADEHDRGRFAALRMAAAQAEVAVAQNRLNALRDEGGASAARIARAELAHVTALRRVAAEHQRASRAADEHARAEARAAAASAGPSRRDIAENVIGGIDRRGRGFNALGTVMGSLKIPAIAGGMSLIASAVSSLGVGAFVAAGQVAQLAASLGAVAAAGAAQLAPLAGALGALPAAIIAVKTATGGFKALTEEPLKAADAIQKYGVLSRQAADALRALSPEARTFAVELAKGRQALEGIREAGQRAALPGIGRALAVASNLLPTLRTGFEQLGGALGTVAQRAAAAFTQPAFTRDLGVIAARNAGLVRTLGGAAVSLVSALRGIVVAAGPMAQAFARVGAQLARTVDLATNSASGQRRLAAFFERTQRLVFSLGRTVRDFGAAFARVFGIAARAVGIDFVGGLESAGARFRRFVESAGGAERIAGFFKRAGDQARTFARTVANLAVAVRNTFTVGARALGIDFVGGLENVTAKFRAFTESVSGQNKIASFFERQRGPLRETGLLIRDIGKAFGSINAGPAGAGLTEMIRKIRTELLPAIVALSTGVTQRLGPALVDVATAFVKFSNVLSFSPIIAVVASVASLTIAIADLIAKVPYLNTVVASLIAMGVAAKALAFAGKAVGLTALLNTVSTIGAKGTLGARGLAGLTQGLRTTEIAAGATATAMNRLGFAVRNLTPASKVIGALLAVLGIAATALGIFKSRQEGATQATEEMTSAISADNGVIAENSRLHAFNALQKSGANDTARKYGISLRALTDAALGNAAAQAEVNRVLDAQARLRQTRDAPGTVGSNPRQARDLADLEAIGRLRRDVGTVSEEAAASQEIYNRQLEAGAVSTANATTATDASSASLDGNSVAARAGAEAQRGLIGVENALERAFFAAGQAADGQRRVTLEEKDALHALAEEITRASAAVLENTANQAAAAQVMADGRTQLILTAIEMGKSEAAAKAYADKMLGIPPVKETRILTPGMPGALVSAARLDSVVRGMLDRKTIVIDVVTRTNMEVAGVVPRQVLEAQRAADRAAAANRQGTDADAAGKREVERQRKEAAAVVARAASSARAARSAATAATAGPVLPGLERRGAEEGARAGETARDAAGRALYAKGGLTAAGRRLVSTLVKSLTGSEARITATSARLADLIRAAFSGAKEKRMLAELEANTKKLRELAALRTKIVEDARSAGQGLTKSIIDSGNVAEAGATTNIIRIIGNLRQQVERAQAFARNLATLRKRGLNADALNQVVAAGPEAGGAAAAELARSTDAQFAAVNKLGGQLAVAAGKAGATASSALFEAGIKAADGLVAGIIGKRASIEAAMLKIAEAMSGAIKRALGIRSPSRVMAGVSDMAIAGLLAPLDAGLAKVRARSDALGAALVPALSGGSLALAAGPIPGPRQPPAAPAGPSIGRQVNIEKIEQVAYNPRPVTQEESARTALRRLAATLEAS